MTTTDDQTEALVSNLEFLGLLSRRKDTATNYDMVAAAARYATLSRTEVARERAGELIADRAERTIADLVLATTADVSPVPPCAGCHSPPDDRRIHDETTGETFCRACAEELTAVRIEPGSIWRIGSAGEVKVDACVLDVTGDGDSAVRFRFRGDLTVRLTALSAVRRWSYIGMLNQCGAEHSAGHQCQRSVSHDGNHWASLRGSGVQWPQVSFAVYSRAPQALTDAIARLKVEPSSLSTEGTARIVELLSSLRDLVYAAADTAKMGQLSDAVFGELHDVCRTLLGSVLMVLSGGQPASPWQEKSFLGAIERLMVDGPLYNARLALDERRREARPTTKRKEPKPVRSLVVVDHGWDEPSDWAGSGPGVLGGRS